MRKAIRASREVLRKRKTMGVGSNFSFPGGGVLSIKKRRRSSLKRSDENVTSAASIICKKMQARGSATSEGLAEGKRGSRAGREKG